MKTRHYKKYANQQNDIMLFQLVTSSTVHAAKVHKERNTTLNDVFFRAKCVFKSGFPNRPLAKRQFKATRLHEFRRMVLAQVQ